MMKIRHAYEASAIPVDPMAVELLESVSEEYLRQVVEKISIPRHFVAEHSNNRFVAGWIERQLYSFGYETIIQGSCANILATPSGFDCKEAILIGAHYDSVPGSPGADDNASAVAALLCCAKTIGGFGRNNRVCFAVFNREEDDLMGSRDFVENYLLGSELVIREVHVLEMVGFASHEPGSQKKPAGLPVPMADTGDFLGLIGNANSNRSVDGLLSLARSSLDGFKVTGLKVYLGLEKHFHHLNRSDHAPFWMAGIPAVMWTDTSEFRNANYHQPTDTPDTLDYAFLKRVTQLLVLRAAANQCS